jgi:hypothetical protein
VANSTRKCLSLVAYSQRESQYCYAVVHTSDGGIRDVRSSPCPKASGSAHRTTATPPTVTGCGDMSLRRLSALVLGASIAFKSTVDKRLPAVYAAPRTVCCLSLAASGCSPGRRVSCPRRCSNIVTASCSAVMATRGEEWLVPAPWSATCFVCYRSPSFLPYRPRVSDDFLDLSRGR